MRKRAWEGKQNSVRLTVSIDLICHFPLVICQKNECNNAFMRVTQCCLKL